MTTGHVQAAIAHLTDVVAAQSERPQEIRLVKATDAGGHTVLVLLIDGSPIVLGQIGATQTVTVGADTITAPTLT